MNEKKWMCLKQNKKSGTTMVEVLVAFLVVMLMMGMFSKVVSTAVQLFNRSRTNIERTEQFSQEYYRSDSNPDKIQGAELHLQLDVDKTDVRNKASYIQLQLKSGYLQVYTSNSLDLKRFSIGILEP